MRPHARLLVSLSLSLSTVSALHIIDPSTCSIPYLVPNAFATVCDRTDEFYHTSLVVEDLDGKPLLFEKPPPYTASIYLQSRPAVWTHEPWCLESVEAQNGFCVYTDAFFGRGRGASFITTPRFMSAMLDTVPHLRYRETLNVTLDTEILDTRVARRQMPNGNGRYTIATQPMKRGDRIHSLTPTVWMQMTGNTLLLPSDQETLINVALERLPAATAASYRDQYATPGHDYPEFDRLEKNSFTARVGVDEHTFIACIPESAIFNHNCRPNLVYNLNPSTLLHEVWVTNDIAPGDELTVSYVSPYDNSTVRPVKLYQHWGFNCTCSLCTAPEPRKRSSDRRLRIIERLVEILNVPFTHRDANVRQAKELVKLHEQEQLWGSLAGAEMYVAMEYMHKKDWRDAKYWGERARDSLRLWAGNGHQYYLGMIRLLTRVKLEIEIEQAEKKLAEQKALEAERKKQRADKDSRHEESETAADRGVDTHELEKTLADARHQLAGIDKA